MGSCITSMTGSPVSSSMSGTMAGSISSLSTSSYSQYCLEIVQPVSWPSMQPPMAIWNHGRPDFEEARVSRKSRSALMTEAVARCWGSSSNVASTLTTSSVEKSAPAAVAKFLRTAERVFGTNRRERPFQAVPRYFDPSACWFCQAR